MRSNALNPDRKKMELRETLKFEPVCRSEESVPEERVRGGDGESVRWGECPMGRVSDGGESSLEPRTSSLNLQSVKSVKSRFTARCRTSFFLILKYGESFQRVNN